MSKTYDSNTISSLSTKSSTPSFTEIYNNPSYKLKAWWEKVQEILFKDVELTDKRKTDPAWLIALISSLNIDRMVALNTLLSNPISSALNISGFHLENYFNSQGVPTKGIYLFTFLKIYTHLLKTADEKTTFYKTIDYSSKKDKLLNTVFDEESGTITFRLITDKFYTPEGQVEKITGLDLIKTAKALNNRSGSDYLLLKELAKMKLSVILDETLKRVPDNIFKKEVYIGIEKDYIKDLRQLLEFCVRRNMNRTSSYVLDVFYDNDPTVPTHPFVSRQIKKDELRKNAMGYGKIIKK